MATDFEPKGLLNDNDALAIPPSDFGPILDFTQVMREVDFVRTMDLILAILPAEGPEISIPMNDIRAVAPSTKENYAKLRPPSRVLELRTTPMALAFCLDIKTYAESVLSTYPSIFSSIRSLHTNPGDDNARTQINNALQTNKDLIERNRRVSKFVVSSLGDFQEIWKMTAPQLLNARERLENDFKTIRDTRVAHWWYFELIKGLLQHWKEIESFFTIHIPDHAFDPNILPSIESMMGTWDAIAGDLRGIEDKMNANRLEELNKVILNINEKQVMKKWDSLKSQCGAYATGNLNKVEARINLNLRDAGVLRQMEDQIMANPNYFAPLK